MTRDRLLRVGSAVGYGIGLAALIVLLTHDGGYGYDAHTYWLAGRHVLEGAPLYERVAIDALGAISYPPLFAQLWAPLALLPELAFTWLWQLACFACLRYLAGSWRNVGLWLLFPLTIVELSSANVTLPAGAALFASLRGRPWLAVWAGSLKYGGLLLLPYLWLSRPAERRALVAGGLVVGVAFVVSFLLAPASWALYVEWLGWQAGLPEVDNVKLVRILPTAAADFALRSGIAAAFLAFAIGVGSDRIAYAASVITVPLLFIERIVPVLAVLRLPGRTAPRRLIVPGTIPAMADARAARDRSSLTIVLPAYNEAERIGPALDELFGYLHRGGPAREGGRSSDELGPWDVLIVDDGSTDETVAAVERRPEAQPGADGASPPLRMIRQPHGGKGSAVRGGMLAATGDLVVFTDADLATPPDQIPLLTEALATHDVALGSRVQPDGSDRRKSQPPYRRLLGRAFRALAAAWVSTGPVPDTQCGFKGFRRDVAQDLFARQRITSIVFDVELIHVAHRQGRSIAIVPVQWSDKRGSRMRLRPGLALRVAWDLLRIPLLHRRAGS